MLFPICLFTRVLRAGVRTGFVQDEQQDPQHIPVTSAFERRIHTSRHSDLFFVIFVNPPFFVGVYTGLRQVLVRHNRVVISKTSSAFAAVICDVDESAPESSFTMSPLCLVDSRASVIQLNLVFATDALAFFFPFFRTVVSRMHACRNALLHSISELCQTLGNVNG